MRKRRAAGASDSDSLLQASQELERFERSQAIDVEGSQRVDHLGARALALRVGSEQIELLVAFVGPPARLLQAGCPGRGRAVLEARKHGACGSQHRLRQAGKLRD